MKTTKLMLIATIIAIASMGMAQSEGTPDVSPDPGVESITISLKAALQNRGLAYAMRTQLNPDFLKVDKPVYCVPVKFGNRLIYITGNLAEWKEFFNMHSDTNPLLIDGKRISLKKAATDAKLFRVMHEQLTPAFLRDEKPVYTVRVKYNNATVYVFGTYNQWKWFFSIDINSDPLDN